jgi:competence ComEA-like helix-hairpin-helix protein
MIHLTDLQHRLGFTRNEVVLILFLSAGLMAGAGIRWLRTGYAAGTALPPPSAYAASDSEFVARGGATGAATDGGATDGATDGLRPAPRRGSSPGKIRPDSASININTAPEAELVRLPGIGQAYARRIIAYRDGHGPFKSVDDLALVSGIGAKRLEALRPFVTVR